MNDDEINKIFKKYFNEETNKKRDERNKYFSDLFLSILGFRLESGDLTPLDKSLPVIQSNIVYFLLNRIGIYYKELSMKDLINELDDNYEYSFLNRTIQFNNVFKFPVSKNKSGYKNKNKADKSLKEKYVLTRDPDYQFRKDILGGYKSEFDTYLPRFTYKNEHCLNPIFFEVEASSLALLLEGINTCEVLYTQMKKVDKRNREVLKEQLIQLSKRILFSDPIASFFKETLIDGSKWVENYFSIYKIYFQVSEYFNYIRFLSDYYNNFEFYHYKMSLLCKDRNFDFSQFLKQPNFPIFKDLKSEYIFTTYISSPSFVKGNNSYSYILSYFKKHDMFRSGITNDQLIGWIEMNFEYKMTRVIQYESIKSNTLKMLLKSSIEIHEDNNYVNFRCL